MRFLCLCESVLCFFEFNFGDDFVHQVIGITSRYQACSKIFNILLKHNFRRVCPEEPKRFFFNESAFNACSVAALEDWASCGVKTNKSACFFALTVHQFCCSPPSPPAPYADVLTTQKNLHKPAIHGRGSIEKK